MKSKFVKSMVGLICLLGVNAASAVDEVVIEDNAAATCEDGNCGKAKYAGFGLGLGLDMTRNSNGLYCDALSYVPPQLWVVNSTYGKKAKTTFGGDFRVVYRFFMTGNFFGLLEAGVRLGRNATSDFKETHEGAGAGAFALGRYPIPGEGKITQKGFVPSFGIGLGGYVCPIDAIVYLETGIARLKVDCEFKFSNDDNLVKQSMSTMRPYVKLGVNKKFYKATGVWVEVRWDPRARKRGYSDATHAGGVLGKYDTTLHSQGFGVGLGVEYSFKGF